MQKTETYQLNLIEGSDPFSQEPINENMLAIESILAKLPKLQTGSYIGTGTYGADSPNTLTFDFLPKVVLVMGYCHFALFMPGLNHGMGIQIEHSAYHIHMATTWEGTTLSWYPAVKYNNEATPSAGFASHQLNYAGETYQYIAIG